MADPAPQELPAFSLAGWTVPGYLESGNGHLTMDGVDLVAVARSRGTPLYVYSERRLRENARAMLDGFRALYPRTTLCYASKACSNLRVLLSTVEGIKDRGPTRWLYLDAGYNTLVESYTYKWFYHSVTANKTNETPLRRFRLAGPLCDNGDAFFDVDGEATVQRLIGELPELEARRALLERLLVRLPGYRELPASTAPGDLVAFLDTGAYTLDQMTPNNGRERAEVAIVTLSGAVETLRRRDSRLDLVMNEVL